MRIDVLLSAIAGFLLRRYYEFRLFKFRSTGMWKKDTKKVAGWIQSLKEIYDKEHSPRQETPKQ